MIEVVLAPGVKLRLTVGPAATEEADSALPAVDVSAVPGARVVMRRGFLAPEARVRAACVTAPADRWAPGIEELVLGRATGLAIGGLGAKIERWEPGAIRAEGGRFEQTLTGRAGEREAAWIRHELVFVGSEHDALLCSVGCEGAACREVVSSVAIEGTLTGPPPPSLLVRAVLGAAERPYLAAAVGGGVSVLIVAILLRFRAKVPGRRFFP